MSTTTATAAPKPDHRKLPRKKRPPSRRDQAIYMQWLAEACPQQQLAEDHGLKQPRISQILQPREEVAGQPAAAGGRRAEPRRSGSGLERWEQQQLHRGIYQRAIRDYDSTPEELTTSKKGEPRR